MSFFSTSRSRHTSLRGDGSSDVCSSDLTTGGAGPSAGGGGNSPATGGTGNVAATGGTSGTGGSAAGGTGGGGGTIIPPQIGRASCRGRGGIAVGARAVRTAHEGKVEGVR